MKYLKRFSLLIIPLILYLISSLIQLYIDPSQTLLIKLIVIGVVTLIFNIIIILMPTDILLHPITLALLYTINFLLLILNFLIGPKIAGTKRWIALGNFTYQPSEMFKPILLIIATLLFSNPHSSYKNNIKTLLAISIPVLGIIFLQPDAGTTIIILVTLTILVIKYLSEIHPQITRQFLLISMWGLVLLGAMVNRAILFLLIPIIFLFKKELLSYSFLILNIIVILTFVIVKYYQFIPGLKPYQKKRIQVFTVLLTTHPLNKALDKQEQISFNLKQARIAIGSGGLTGKGLENITQSRLKFLPEYKTDFMYATISESFGLLGVLSLLSLYMMLIYIINSYAKGNLIGEYLAFGISSLLFIELIINIGGNLGLLPTKGIPLPFLGYGGTSLLAHTFLLSYMSHFQGKT